ncbi:MAG: tyrosine-type recombinase/integrase [Marmoricola sp.]
MVSRRTRTRKDGTVTIQLLWRENGKQQGHTVYSEHDANVWERLIDQTGSWDAAAKSYRALKDGAYTVAQAVEDHIGLLLKPHGGTMARYQSMLRLHVKDSIGAVPVGELSEQHIVDWVRGMLKKKLAPKTIRNVHGLLSSALERCVPSRIPSNPCRNVDLPSTEHAEDMIRFLRFDEFVLIRDAMPDRYQPFLTFLVVTGARFSEATAVTIRDVNFDARPATVRINKSWKRVGTSEWIVGPPKSPSAKRTISLPDPLAESLRGLAEGRSPDDLLFTNERGSRVRQSVFYSLYKERIEKLRDVRPDFTADPTIHDLRHTSASWLIQSGFDLFKVARRLGHANTSMVDKVYGHLMPEAQIEGVRHIETAMRPEELEQPDPDVEDE